MLNDALCYFFLFCSWPSRLRTIFRATKTHALNLAKFVSLYKTLLLLQKRANGGKERSWDTFIAGMLGGYVVFGERNAINEQVTQSPHLVLNDTAP
jgi:peroxisomal membrane protein 4